MCFFLLSKLFHHLHRLLFQLLNINITCTFQLLTIFSIISSFSLILSVISHPSYLRWRATRSVAYHRHTSILFSPGKSISEVGSASRGWLTPETNLSVRKIRGWRQPTRREIPPISGPTDCSFSSGLLS